MYMRSSHLELKPNQYSSKMLKQRYVETMKQKLINDKILSRRQIETETEAVNDNDFMSMDGVDEIVSVMRLLGVEVLQSPHDDRQRCTYYGVECKCIFQESLDHILEERNGFYNGVIYAGTILSKDTKLRLDEVVAIVDDEIEDINEHREEVDTTEGGLGLSGSKDDESTAIAYSTCMLHYPYALIGTIIIMITIIIIIIIIIFLHFL